MAGENSSRSSWLYHPEFPQHWECRPLYSLAEWINGLAFRDISFSTTGIPVIKIAEIKGGISGQTKFTQQAFHKSVRVRHGEMLFSWSGQPETSIDVFWWRGPEGWLNQHVFRVIPKASVDRTFFYYLLRYLRPNFVGIASNKQTTGLGHVTKRDLENIEVAYPAIAEQRAIAHILGTLDDKIELNRRMNQTLEAMARAIFQSWFVDFDPVRANQEARRAKSPRQKPSRSVSDAPDVSVTSDVPDASVTSDVSATVGTLAREIATLFPHSFQDSELGEIPKGWEVGDIADMAEVFSGKRPAVRYPEASVEANVPLWGGNGPMAFAPEPLIDYPVLLTGRVGTLGSVFRILSPCWPSDNTLIMRAREEHAFEYLFFQLRQIDFLSLNRGSTQPLLTQTDLKAQRIPLPPSRLLVHFHLIAKSLYHRIDGAEAESRALAVLRNVLLPKLISGALRVPDAERIAGRCV